jgi:predicted DNA-binding protein
LNAWKFGVRKTSDPPRKTITVRLPENSYERLRYVVSSSRAGTTLQKVISEVIGQYLERVG